MLGAELDKIETFYAERAKEMHEHAKMLRKQLDKLGMHRQMFYVSTLRCGWTHMPINCDPVRNRPRSQRLRVGLREHIFLSHLHFHH